MKQHPPELRLIGVPGIPLIDTGDNLAWLIAEAMEHHGLSLQHSDVLVITSKIVSKAEGRWANIEEIEPDEEARRVAQECDKDPREVALILRESQRISRLRKGVLITTHKLGFTSANAGIDHSNTREGGQWRLLLPEDPDRSARELRAALASRFGARIAVIISDSHGRPFRFGTVGAAIGAAGLPTVRDLRGQPDLFGYILQGTDVAFADEIAAAAGLITGQTTEMLPVVILRGLNYPQDEQASARDLVRPPDLDLYR